MAAGTKAEDGMVGADTVEEADTEVVMEEAEVEVGERDIRIMAGGRMMADGEQVGAIMG